MSRPQFQPTKRKFVGAPTLQREPILIAEARLNTGMSSFIDPADLPPTYLSYAKNIRTYADRVFRRPGIVDNAPTKPNSNRVLLYTLCTRFDQSSVYLRFNPSSIHRQATSSWVAITGSALGLTTTSRPRLITLNDRFFFTTGVDEIQEIDFSGDTYADLGNAPKYKYICGFFNRLVGANLYDASSPNPTLVGWSGDLDFGEWNPLTNISAGSTPLLEAQSDYADPITGLFGFAQVMLILRERSLWLASKRPVASNPFQFQAAFPSVGCDSPDSASQKRNGITWYDRRSNQVYDYTIGSAPTPIGDSIRKEIAAAVDDVTGITGTYDAINDRYHLLVFSENSTTARVFVYDYRTQSWSIDELSNIYSISALDSANPALVIDDLTGTIDSLVGTIDSLTISSVVQPNIFYGSTDGEVYSEDSSMDEDEGDEVEMDIRSKIFTLPSSDVSINRLLFKVDVVRPGSLMMWYSKNGGESWTSYKTVTLSDTGRHILTAPRHLTTSEYMWRLTSSTGRFEVLEYRIEGLASTITRSS